MIVVGATAMTKRGPSAQNVRSTMTHTGLLPGPRLLPFEASYPSPFIPSARFGNTLGLRPARVALPVNMAAAAHGTLDVNFEEMFMGAVAFIFHVTTGSTDDVDEADEARSVGGRFDVARSSVFRCKHRARHLDSLPGLTTKICCPSSVLSKGNPSFLKFWEQLMAHI